MDTTLRGLALPLLHLANEVFGATRIPIAGDTQSILFIMKTGRNPTVKHLPRMHKVTVAWHHEQHMRENFEFSMSRPTGWQLMFH